MLDIQKENSTAVLVEVSRAAVYKCFLLVR